MDWKIRILSDASALDLAVSRRIPAAAKLIAVLALMMIMVQGLGCSRKATPALAVQQRSAIQVQVGADGIRIQTPSAQFVLLPSGYLKAALLREGKSLTLDDADVKPGQRVSVGGKEVLDLAFDLSQAKISAAGGKLGPSGKHIEVAGRSTSSGLVEKLAVEVYDDFPSVALASASFQNTGSHDLPIDAISIVARSLNATLSDSQAAPYQMWSFHGASIKSGKDDVLPLTKKFSQENPFGAPVETGDDLGRVGGGIPVVAFWTRSVGEALGHVETFPLALSVPVKTQANGHVNAAVRFSANTTLKPGETYSTPRTFVAVYSGDYYEPLSLWSKMVDREGLSRPANNDENYAISWCGWGYESNVTPKQMVDTIPKLKELGIHWATLDDRWFNNYGDWQPRPDTFPDGSIQTTITVSRCRSGGSPWQPRMDKDTTATTSMYSPMS